MSTSILKKKFFNKKSIRQNLKLIYGLGYSSIEKICKKIGISSHLNYNNLRTDQISFLFLLIEKNYFLIENNLRLFKKNNLTLKEKIKNYKYWRNKNKMPSRGQRTHTNAKTKKKMPYGY